MNLLEKLGKEFRTECTESTHRGHREFPDPFSVHSVVQRFDNAKR